VGRHRRQYEPDGIYHVASRGNNRSALFLDEADRLLFTDLLGRYALRHGWLVLAHCLMTTHYHLILKVPDGALSDGMCLLNGDFSRKANRRHGRGGHLFHDRYAATPIKGEGHLLEACRYVVLNPVRAGLCDSPAAWRWSSYRASAGIDVAPSFLAEFELLSLFGPRSGSARRAYRDFVAEGQRKVPGSGAEGRPVVAGTGL
jgi:REP-associated tyrosine transposase